MKYKSPDEIALAFFFEMTKEERDFLKSIVSAPEDMSIFHNTVGRQIRNEYGLWFEDNPYTDLDSETLNPDEVSFQILQKICVLVHESD